MNVRITQLDGKLPNLALMRLSHYHRDCGDIVVFTRSPYRHMDEPHYERVYGSAIFDYTRYHVQRLLDEFPGQSLEDRKRIYRQRGERHRTQCRRQL